MSQIRDPRLRPSLHPEPLTHPLHLSLNRLPPAVQHVRVQVPLERDGVGLDERAGERGLDEPVEAEDVVPRVLGEVLQGVVGAFGEEDERDGGDVLGGEIVPDGGGDAFEVGVGEFGEVVWGEVACV